MEKQFGREICEAADKALELQGDLSKLTLDEIAQTVARLLPEMDFERIAREAQSAACREFKTSPAEIPFDLPLLDVFTPERFGQY